MAQLFHPGELLALKVVLLGVAAAVAAVGVTIYNGLAGGAAPGHAPAQPIPFSHKHHVGDDGIDCRYCHTTVEKSRFAGLPSSEICLTCHSQLFVGAAPLQPLHDSAASGRPLQWNRVHDLPDFVYFDHSIHIAKGVACVECHGHVERMPLTRRVASLEMQWCLACHRDPLPHLRAPGAVFDPEPLRAGEALHERDVRRLVELLGQRRLTDCSTCHR